MTRSPSTLPSQLASLEARPSLRPPLSLLPLHHLIPHPSPPSPPPHAPPPPLPPTRDLERGTSPSPPLPLLPLPPPSPPLPPLSPLLASPRRSGHLQCQPSGCASRHPPRPRRHHVGHDERGQRHDGNLTCRDHRVGQDPEVGGDQHPQPPAECDAEWDPHHQAHDGHGGRLAGHRTRPVGAGGNPAT